MRYEAIHHVLLPVPNLGAAVDAYERLGLRVGPEARPIDPDLMQRTLSVGSAGTLCEVEFLSVDPNNVPATPLGTRLAEPVFEKAGLYAVALRVADLSATLKDLSGRGVVPRSQGVLKEAGKAIGQMALLAEEERAATNLLLVQFGQTVKGRYAARSKAGLLEHALPLRRLDHLAAIARDLETQTRFWVDILGVPLFGEVRTPTLVIRQFKIGDAIVELLGPATADSPLNQRAPGLISMASWQVDDLSSVVTRVRAAGFTISEPTTGALPGTQTATIPGSELGGLTMQLLQYVS